MDNRDKELFDIVDRAGHIIGQTSRQVCHSGPGLLHRVAHVLVFNSRGELYLQKRSQTKDIQPGKWDTSVGGHLAPGEDFRKGGCRELEEELGIKEVELAHLYDYIWESERESELVSAFKVIYDGPIRFDPLEIEEGRFFTFSEIESKLGSGLFTPNFEEEYKRYNEQDKLTDEAEGGLAEVFIVTDVLDLHGFFPQQIPDTIREFIRNAIDLRLNKLRIIHGKGKSKLKYLVRQELKKHPQVVYFADASPEFGGWGATVVELAQNGELKQ
ncbi:MAG: Smr/MutS family protein [bacterium]